MATKPQIKPETKRQKRLTSRVEDYARMMQDTTGRAYRAPQGAFHQPGSNNK